jgi:putative lipoic acid-binding regulatory protein
MTESALTFPCTFPIKAMGLAGNDFDLLVVEIIRKHAPDLGEGAVQTRASSGGKYLSVTVTIEAVSQEQLDAIYMELSGHERVVMAL